MSGLFDACGDCCLVAGGFLMQRTLYGFVGFEGNGTDTTNPITYFLGGMFTECFYENAYVALNSKYTSITNKFTQPTGIPTTSHVFASGFEFQNLFSNPNLGQGSAILPSCEPGSRGGGQTPTSNTNVSGTNTDGSTFTASYLTAVLDYETILSGMIADIATLRASAPGGGIGCGFCYIGTYNDVDSTYNNIQLTAPTYYECQNPADNDYTIFDGSLQNVGGMTWGSDITLFGFQTIGSAFIYFQADYNASGGFGSWGDASFQVFQDTFVIPPGPYIIATFILMMDGTFVFDTYGPGSSCADYTSSGAAIIVPMPSFDNLPTSLYTNTGGTLNGPVGRINFVVIGTDCATFSASPTPPSNSC